MDTLLYAGGKMVQEKIDGENPMKWIRLLLILVLILLYFFVDYRG
jgi:hypothetical protein